MWYNPGIYLGGISGQKSRKKLRDWENLFQNQVTFIRLVNEALQRYSIENLPDTISERQVLLALLWYGAVVFFEKDGGLYALPGAPTGKGWNINNDPGSAWVYSPNGQYNKEVVLYIPGSDDSVFLQELVTGRQTGTPTGVIVWENRMRYPFINSVFFFSECIADCYRTLDVTRFWLKRPLILTGPEEYSESVKKVIREMGDNPEAVYLKDLLGVQKGTTLLNTNANGQNLQDVTGLLEWYENQFRAICGLDSNAQMDKKGENLITAEITVNDQYQEMSLDKSIVEIQTGLDSVNKFFGTNITVEKNKAVQKQGQENSPEQGQEGGTDDNV